ncbi:hypothetical protein FNH22_08800 [Fulvivirga sp. M361]|uniref:NapC/NirT family cytochrome c n=1 Tax=Fulvivirga sp. M361 TaxID=2594266 RepID=UPI00117AFA40|nr:NapC/NirT family cytochrome c [Fulvivirga sp. M361]TRX60137.1 hypothetical protein FNH22_08800 [Fulvivirga sp. M361]
MNIEIIKIVGLILVLIELILLFKLLSNKGTIKARSKWLAFFAIITIPIITIFTANYHVFETSKTVQACMSCHVMKPMGNDMLNHESQTLAARHMTNNWIKEDQCYGCHKDYGLNGTLKAKTDGYRHLMRYVTGTYSEPIVFRGEFDSQNCLNCHQGTPSFENLKAHEPVVLNLEKETSTISCTNCHGKAHPTRAQRTPGHSDYDQLMGEGAEFEQITDEDVSSIKAWLTNTK